jgi:AcrR family transcriptional regulator
MALYGERGFDNTTVAEIAERAGLTERTFFRHFADKREVLFAGSKVLQDQLVSAVQRAPESWPPIDAAIAGVDAAGEMLGDRQPLARQRRLIIEASAELRERELIKLASLSAALADALRARGTPDPTAGLVAEIAIAVFRIAFERWTTEGEDRGFPELVRESLEQLRAATAGEVPAGAS